MQNKNSIKISNEGDLISANILDWVNELNKSIHLPRIQRGFVWKPQQIASLWDSLLRGMPFGTLLVSRITRKTQVKDGNKLISVESGWQLLDGQQRTRTIQGGFDYSSKNSQFRIWLGIGKPTDQEMLFDLKVTTEKQPFGFDNTFKVFPLSTRRDAYRLFKKKHSDKQLNLDTSFPYSKSNKVYIPLDILLSNINDLDIMLKQYELEEASLERKEKIKQAILRVKDIKIYSQCVSNEHYHLEETVINKVSNIEPGIEVLFKRIGLGGTGLSNNDYAYSLIKQRFESAHELIESTLEIKHANQLFSSLDIVAIALRASCKLACDGRRKSDSDHYNKSEIYRILSEAKNTDYITRDLLQALSLKAAVNKLINLVAYHKNNNQNGIPVQLLRLLPKAILQVIIIHLVDNYKYKSNELISFCLYWLLLRPSSKNTKKLSKILLKVNGSEKSVIQSYVYEIKKYYSELNMNVALINSNDFSAEAQRIIKSSLSSQGHQVIRLRDTILSDKDGIESPAKQVLSKFWGNKSLLIWFQRLYLDSLVSNTNSLIASEITPYDFDHIIPQNYWSNATTVKGKQFSHFIHTNEKMAKWELGNSIGNYQLLSFTENRKKSNNDYITSQNAFNINDRNKLFHISNVCHNYFLDTPNKGDKWEKASVIAFQAGVVTRVHELYEELFLIFEPFDYYFVPYKSLKGGATNGTI